MTTYYAAQLLIALSVVDSHEDNEINLCVIQETDIIKLIQEQGKFLYQIHPDDLLTLVSTKHASFKQTVASTQIKTRLLEKKTQIGHNIDLLLNRTSVNLFVQSNEQKNK